MIRLPGRNNNMITVKLKHKFANPNSFTMSWRVLSSIWKISFAVNKGYVTSVRPAMKSRKPTA